MWHFYSLHSFSSELWSEIISESWWVDVAKALEVERLFRKGEIKGERRESTAGNLLYGDGVDVERIEHGVRFIYRITECMFSQGNLNERARMGCYRRRRGKNTGSLCGDWITKHSTITSRFKDN